MQPASAESFLKWRPKQGPILEQLKAGGERLVLPWCENPGLIASTSFRKYLISGPEHLVELYKLIQEHPRIFFKRARELFGSQSYRAFSVWRDEYNQTKDHVVLFWLLHHAAGRTGIRFNTKGEYNMPFQKSFHTYFPERELRAFILKAPRCEFVRYIDLHIKKTDTVVVPSSRLDIPVWTSIAHRVLIEDYK